MSVIALPADLPIESWSMGQADFSLFEMSDSTGHTAGRVLGPPRWTISMSSPAILSEEAAGRWEAMILSLRGRTNHLSAWDITRPAPLGTLRGTLTLSAAPSAGASSVTITGGTNGQTIKSGDWFQIGTGVGTSQLVKATADATVSGGAVTLTFEPPLRIGFSIGAAVAWDKPLAYYKRRSGNVSWSGVSGTTYNGSHTLDLIEQWGT